MKPLAGILLGTMFVLTACSTTDTERPLEITFIDVGAGSAILIRTPDQRTCLIDGGPTYAGANRICPLLDSLRITELDYTIATNYTPERIGGLDEVIRHLGGEEGVLYRCYDRGAGTAGQDFREYNKAARSRRQRMKPGELIDMGELSIWCIASNGRVVGRALTSPTNEKDRSIALLVSYGDFDMLVLSDLASYGRDGRLALAEEAARVADGVELLVVPDGGSRYSVSDRLRQDVEPTVSVIQCATGDSSLPSQHVINELTRRGSRVYTTGRVTSAIIPTGAGRTVGSNIRVTVGNGGYTVAGDTFRSFN